MDDLVTRLATRFSLVDTTMWGIQFVSTIQERALLLALCSIVLAAVLLAVRRSRSVRLRQVVPVLVALVLFQWLYWAFPTTRGAEIGVALALVVGLAVWPARLWKRKASVKEGEIGVLRWLFAVILVPSLAVSLLNGWSLLGLAHKLHPDDAVQQFGDFDVDSLALDAEDGVLYVTGHETDNLLAYDLKDLGRAPRRSPVRTNKAQSFFYNQANHELYVFNDDERALLVLDSRTLGSKRTVSGLQIQSGDARIEYDPRTDSIIIASEGEYWGPGSAPDEKTYPIAVVKREDGHLLYTVSDCRGRCIPGLILVHPSRPLLYLVFPKKVLVYDTEARRVVAASEVQDQWIDGMALTPDGKELLVGVPLHSAVWRLDAETLKLKGTIGTVFGVRTLAIDRQRKLLLTASLVDNMVDVIDLESYQRLAQYYVAPWLRMVCLDTGKGFAYVSSTEGLYKVNYTSRLRPRAAE